jgi:hypothetical protein
MDTNNFSQHSSQIYFQLRTIIKLLLYYCMYEIYFKFKTIV